MDGGSLVIATGAPRTGKTTVLEYLGGEIQRFPESAREILAQQRAVGGARSRNERLSFVATSLAPIGFAEARVTVQLARERLTMF